MRVFGFTFQRRGRPESNPACHAFTITMRTRKLPGPWQRSFRRCSRPIRRTPCRRKPVRPSGSARIQVGLVSVGSVTLISLPSPPLGFLLAGRSFNLTRDFGASFLFDFDVFMQSSRCRFCVQLRFSDLPIPPEPAGQPPGYRLNANDWLRLDLRSMRFAFDFGATIRLCDPSITQKKFTESHLSI